MASKRGQLSRRAALWTRGNVLGLVAIFLALNGTAIALQAADNKGAAHDRQAQAAKKKKKAKPGPAGPAGVAGPAGPAGPAGTTGQDATTVFGTGVVTAGGSFQAVPGLTQTLTVPPGAKVVVASDGGVDATMASFGGADVALSVDSTVPADGFSRRVISDQSSLPGNWSFSGVVAVGAGNHTFAVVTQSTGGSPVHVSGDSNNANQGELTVMILKN